MNKGIIEVGSEDQKGARINLSIDLMPEDCFIMCKQLFSRLKDEEKQEILSSYTNGD